MKKSLCFAMICAGTAFTLFSCQKVNSVNDEEIADKKKPRKDVCLISSFGYSNSAIPQQTIFTNHYDLSGRSMEIEAGLFSGGSVFSNLKLSVKWVNGGIAFVDASAPQDTILLASFNKRGRIDKIIAGNKPNPNFLPTSFEYDPRGLRAMYITLAGNTLTSYFNYDHNGNLISIDDAPSASVSVPGKVEYTYDANQKANDQFYFDEPRGFSWNTFSLVQYLGLFPELQPTSLRTSTKVMWGNNYQAYHMNIINQQLDGNGKLISYDVASPGSNATISHYNINWSCNLTENLFTQGNQ